jgi:acetyl esterase
VTTTSDSTSPAGPGRLGDPAATLATDPRAHVPLRDQLTAFGLGEAAAAAPLGREAGHDEILGFVTAAEEGFEGLYAAISASEAAGEGTTRSEVVIRGRGGHDIPLYVFRPLDSDPSTPLPAVIYIHGGGMTILLAANGVHTRWCEDLARTGLVVIAVDYRNAAGARGPFPFPAGLEDCCDALAWVDEHRDELGVAGITLQGESGGANLCLATTLSAKRAGTLEAIDGVYAMVPYISGGYGWPEERRLAELPSLVENDGWFINCSTLDLLVAAYDPADSERENPLAWPYFATVEDLRGLPPHVISVNELDPLRDEGVAYFRRLQEAGVPATGRVNLGFVHAADLIFKTAVGDAYDSVVADISRFARRVSGQPRAGDSPAVVD